jgi:hypothetical protein
MVNQFLLGWAKRVDCHGLNGKGNAPSFLAFHETPRLLWDPYYRHGSKGQGSGKVLWWPMRVV